MALSLNKQCKAKLVEDLAKILQDMKVNSNVFLDYESVVSLKKLNRTLPERGSVYENLKKYIGDAPLSTFIEETINMELATAFEYDSKIKGVPLISFTNYSQPQEVASRFIEDFDSLPFNYLVTFEFPPPLGQWLREEIELPFKLSNTMKIILPDTQYDQTHPLSTGKKQIDRGLFDSYWVIENFGAREPNKWNQRAAHFQAHVTGFVGEYSLTAPIAAIMATLKSMFGLAIALNFIKVRRGYLVRPRVRHLIFHQRVQNKWQIFHTRKLAMDFAELLDNVEVSENRLQEGDTKNAQWNQALLFFLQLIFSSPADKAERLLKASQWLMDSYAGNNELLAFVQAMIAMEVLLGEEGPEDIGIGELIRNRCAYLVGENNEDRDQISKSIKDIYEVRSAIVHRGKNTLNNDEKELFYTLRWLSSRVILKEIMLLSKDKQLNRSAGNSRKQ